MFSDTKIDQSLRLRFFRRQRPATIAEVGAQLWQLLDTLAALHPGWKQWSTRDAGFQPHRVRSAAECAQHLDGAEIELLPGNWPTHRLIFSSAGPREQSCDLRVLFALQGGAARWNLGLRLEMRIGSSVRGLGSSGATLVQQAALAAVHAFQPHAGFVGTMIEPDLRRDESREPEAAWMTYLSRAANAEPFREQFLDSKLAPSPTVPPPATVAPVLDLGWFIVAFPEIMNPGDAEQRAAVDGVRRALGPRVRQDALAPVPATPEVAVLGNPAYVGAQASSSVLSPWAGRAKSSLAGTSLAVEVPVGEALPFVRTGSASEALERAVKEAEQVQGPKPSGLAARLDGTAASLDLSAILQALPFTKDAVRSVAPSANADRSAPPLPPVAPVLTLEQHASLCVELALAPARAAETLARYRITPQEKTLVDQYYRDSIAASPEARASWERSYQSYHTWLRSSHGRTR